MSDEALRSAERRYRKTQSEADAAALLGARVRAGKIKPEYLRLAAFLGHRAASLAVQEDHPRPTSDPALLLRVLTDWGPEVEARAAAAVAFCALATLTASERGAETELRRDYVNIASRAISRRRGGRFDCPALPPRHSQLRNKRGEILESLQSVMDRLRKKNRRVVQVFRETGNLIRTANDFHVADADLVRAITSDLLPWIIGESDPLVTRLSNEREWLPAPPPEPPQQPDPPESPHPPPLPIQRRRTPPADARRQQDREKSPPVTLSGQAAEKRLADLRAMLKATNRGITCRLTEADVLFVAVRSTSAAEGLAWMIAPDPSPYAWSDRKHALVLAWSRKGRTSIRLTRVRSYRGNGGTPASWPELRGFPRGDLLAKLSAWSEADDALTFRTNLLTTQRTLSSAHHADVSVLSG